MKSSLSDGPARGLDERASATDPANRQTSGLQGGTRMAIALAAVLITGAVARSWGTLAPPLVVGDDGAYYLVQVRGILRNGALAIPDFPLLFYLQACVAHLVSLMLEQRAAIIAAVRITDTFLPLALAVPVFHFARAFGRPGDRPARGAVAIALVGLIAVASGNSLAMAGGMIKNSAALPCSFLFSSASLRWLRKGKPSALVWPVFWFVLGSLTHMSGLLLSAALAAGILAVGLVTPVFRPRLRLPVILLAAALAGCFAIVHAFDPERAQRLLHAVISPGWLFAESPAMLWLRGISGEALGALFTSPQVWVGNILGVLGVVTLFRHRTGMDPSTRVLLVASTLVTLAFSSPFLRPDVLERLALVAYMPGMIPIVYLVCRESAGTTIVAPLTLALSLQGVLAVKTLRLTALVPAAHEELVRFRSALPPGQVIVITRPLLRWWAAWTLETRFSTRIEPALAERAAYDAMLLLYEIRAGAFGLAPGPPGIGGLAAGVRDADRLRPETVSTLEEGTYFRLSTVKLHPVQ